MSDPDLIPPEPERVQAALSSVLRRSFSGHRGPSYMQVAGLAAAHIAEALARENFVIMLRDIAGPNYVQFGRPAQRSRKVGP